MKKKRLAALAVAFALVLSLSVSAFAVAGVGIGDIIGVISSIDASEYTKYNEQEWTTLTPAERAEQLNYVINHQKGTSHLNESSDLINDSAASFQAYDILSGNSSVGGALLGGDASSNMIMKIGLEQKGYADFGMGYYNSNGHSSGKFGDGTVADTLNDDFLDYMRDVPYGSNTRYLFSNGYSISWEPVFLSNESAQMDINGVKHQAAYYRLRFLLYDASGVLCDTAYGGSIAGYGRFDDRVCLTCGIQPFSDLTITDDGYYFYSVSSGSFQHKFHDSPIPQKIKLPWYDKYGQPTVVTDDPLATGTDENGNQIQFNINSDGVTYEGSTYNYNDDNSVTINGNTYYITVNPKDVDEDYYKKFLQQVINNYYNYYNTDSTPFDGKDILTAVKSVFTSLETFRSYCYSQLKQLSDYVFDGFNSLRFSVKSLKTSISDRLDDIIKILKNISNTVDDISEEKKQEYNTKWLEAIGKVKKKFCYDEIKANIDNCYNAMFNAEYSEIEQAEVIATYAYNDGSGAEPIKKNGTFLPAITVEIFGQEYNLLSCIGSFTPYMDGIKDIISMFLIITFILSLFRSLPAMIGGVSSVVTSTPQFQDFSDKTEVEFYRSKYDR